MLEFLFQAVGEFLLQVIVEALVELGFHSLAEPFRKPPNPWLAGLGYGLLGAIAGGLSLLLFPAYLVSGGWRWANLILTPVAVGLLMCLIGQWRVKRGQELLRIDRFAYGYVFALSFALVRFCFAG
jgi:hypothetical protein